MSNLLLIIFLLSYLLVDKFVFKTSQRWGSSLLKSVLVYIITIRIAHLIPSMEMYKSTGFVPTHHLLKFVAIWGCTALSALIINKICNKFLTYSVKEKPWPVWFKISFVLLITLASFIFFFAIWFRDYFGNLSPEQFLFNLQSPITGTSDGMSMQIVFNPLFNTLFVALIVSWITFSSKYIYIYTKVFNKFFARKVAAFLFALVILCGSSYFTIKFLHLNEVVAMYYDESEYIAKNYVDIRKVKTVMPEQKRNLIHIYFESVENTYFDKTNGGYMDENLMPELLELTKEGISFSHNDKMGGPHQTHASGWSVAGMVNMSSGVPLKVAVDGNSYGLDGFFLPGIYNMGDFLHDNGYEQTVMFGADAEFGGLDVFFTGHGHYNIFDWKYAQKVGLIPKDYKVWWGFEDNKLFEFAKQEMTRLSKTGKPFNFTMENADTHFPNGFMEPETPQKYASQYANVIAYNSKQLVDLVRWIQQQEWYKNTTIVITGDHLSMDQEFFKDIDPSYHRTTYNLFLNSAVTTQNTKNRQFSPVDYYPTILASMGVEIRGNRLGLGTNLFSNVPTLVEKDGVDKFNEELRANSDFFTKEILDGSEHQRVIVPKD